jgi:hypothetical protein
MESYSDQFMEQLLDDINDATDKQLEALAFHAKCIYTKIGYDKLKQNLQYLLKHLN